MPCNFAQLPYLKAIYPVPALRSAPIWPWMANHHISNEMKAHGLTGMGHGLPKR